MTLAWICERSGNHRKGGTFKFNGHKVTRRCNRCGEIADRYQIMPKRLFELSAPREIDLILEKWDADLRTLELEAVS